MSTPQGNNGSQTLVAGVRFRPAGRIYYYDAHQYPNLKTGQYVIVETQRGKEAGRIVIAPKQVAFSELGDAPKAIERLAEEDDLRSLLDFKAKERDALRTCNDKVQQRQLPMKLVEAEYAYDGSRVTFYFVAEDRVDFRALVRDLAAAFRTRIELRQIGARDHAKALGGVGPCGKTLCCSSWLTEFGAVSIKMAKEQSLPLNPTKISGVCGRLMCCLAYENDQYVDAKQSMPKPGDNVLTPSGLGRIVGQNVPRTSVDVLLESGATITVPVREVSRPDGSALPTSHGGCSTDGGGCCSTKT
ncbi:MAG: stage 0 sporulation family protein [Ktedonobacterales bacterium]|nr:stage 0 sporulation family protein [Ktedonobacterales bacterium]